MSIKAFEVSLTVGGNPSGIAVPALTADQVLASGYYTDPDTGYRYYYNAATNQWYLSQGLYLVPLAEHNWIPSPVPRIDLIPGVDTLRFNVSFTYWGPAIPAQGFYVALMKNATTGSPDEWEGYTKQVDKPIPKKDTPGTVTIPIDLPIPAGGGHDGEVGAAYCKLWQWFWTEGISGSPYYRDVCYIVKAKGEFSNFSISKFEKVS